MHTNTLSVAERIAALKTIFADLGIPAAPNSILEQTIVAEFGRGKRSALNQILQELHQDTDIIILSAAIGAALEREFTDPQILTTAKFLQQRLPNVLQIIDVRQQTAKRINLLEKLLGHFEHKLLNVPNADRLLRMLSSAKAQLKSNLELQSAIGVAENISIIFDQADLKRTCRIFKSLTPALIALDHPTVATEQKINYCVQALLSISTELHHTKLTQIASIIDTVHWLAKVNLPSINDAATTEQALHSLGISLGTITIHNLRQKARLLGLTEKELIQVLYSNKATTQLDITDKNLILVTQENQQYAATCGLVAKLGQEIKCKELERVGVAGICLVSMRQTFYEIKTNNLNSVNFSESLGLILSGVGVLTKNPVLAKIGGCILDGVKAYAGIMAIPGAQVIAVPLAICTVLSKLFVTSRQKSATSSQPAMELVLHHMLEKTLHLQQEMRTKFVQLYALVQDQHKELLTVLDQGFANLMKYNQYYNAETLQAIHRLDTKLDILQFNISKEFVDLYLEYIRDPVEELQFFERYGQGDLAKLPNNKIKLSMWMLFKSKHSKVNGRDLIAHVENTQQLSSYVAVVLTKINEYDAILGMINRYVNIEFNQKFSEELPHIPTWLLAANTYIHLLADYSHLLPDSDKEPKIISDMQDVGNQVLHFIRQIANAPLLWKEITLRKNNFIRELNSKLQQLSQIDMLNYMQSYEQLIITSLAIRNKQPFMAQSAAVDEQLEPFTTISLDISAMWQQNISNHIPAEFIMAEVFGLGELQINFVIDKNVNNFVNIRMPYSHNLLPDDARDVLYRIEVSFKARNSEQSLALLTGWFAYDLCNLYKRLEEYYRLKFKNGLRHTRYYWISLNGRRNLVHGYPEGDTNKLIDYNRLALIYKNWWDHVRPVNEPTVLARVKQNPQFMAVCKNMLENEQNVIIQQQNIDLLKFQLQAQLRTAIITKRTKIKQDFEADVSIAYTSSKMDAYNAVLAIFKQVINVPVVHEQIGSRLNELLAVAQNSGAEQIDYDAKLKLLLLATEPAIIFNGYRQGSLYQKIQHTLSRLQLLLHNYTAAGLRFNS